MKNRKLFLLAGLFAALAFAGCDNMRDNNRYKPYEETPFFENRSTARELPAGTVARGFLRDDSAMYQGKTAGGAFVSEYPIEITKDVLARGRDRYDIYCLVCHGKTGMGDGLVVRRGYKQPFAFQDKSVKRSPGYIYDAISNGFGVMAPFNTELSPEDRWAVAAYVETLGRIEGNK